ncbi:MAG: Flp pilus assembly protein CpaB [Bryobacteraceae bacterium]
MRKNILPLFGIALLAAAAATGVFYLLLPQDAASAHATVVVAARDVEMGARLQPEDLRVEPWKQGPVPEGALRLVSEAAGRVALRPLAAGELLKSGALAPAGAGALAAIPPGMRAVSLHPVDSQGVVAMLEPGSRVDVQVVNLRGEPFARRVLEDVEVLRVQKSDLQRPAVTVLARPEDADRLSLADAQQQIRLLARNPAERSAAAAAAR